MLLKPRLQFLQKPNYIHKRFTFCEYNPKHAQKFNEKIFSQFCTCFHFCITQLIYLSTFCAYGFYLQKYDLYTCHFDKNRNFVQTEIYNRIALFFYLIFNPNSSRSPKNKNKWSINKFTRILCLLLIGFLVGNLFGTFLNTIRKYIIWDGFIVFVLISSIELLSYAVYHNKNRSFFFIIHPWIIKRSFWKSINFFKIGLLIGFFVDAFKVGS